MTGASEQATHPAFPTEVLPWREPVPSPPSPAPSGRWEGRPLPSATRSSWSHPPPPSPQGPGRSSSHREGGPSCQCNPVTTLNPESRPSCCECRLASADSPGKDMEPGQIPSMDSGSECFSSTRSDSTNQRTSLPELCPQL